MRFIYEGEGKRVEMSIDDDSNLSDTLLNFGEFLKAVGYVFDGEVTIVEEDSSEIN